MWRRLLLCAVTAIGADEPLIYSSLMLTEPPTIRPSEFSSMPVTAASPPAIQQPAVPWPEAMQVLQVLFSNSVNQMEAWSKLFAEDFRKFLQQQTVAVAPPSLRGVGANALQQHTGSRVQTPQFVSIEPSFWKSATHLNDAINNSVMEWVNQMTSHNQEAINGWFGVLDQWARVIDGQSAFQQRVANALWRLHQNLIGTFFMLPSPSPAAPPAPAARAPAPAARAPAPAVEDVEQEYTALIEASNMRQKSFDDVTAELIRLLRSVRESDVRRASEYVQPVDDDFEPLELTPAL